MSDKWKGILLGVLSCVFLSASLYHLLAGVRHLISAVGCFALFSGVIYIAGKLKV